MDADLAVDDVVSQVLATLGEPPEADPDSFVLHAPLELAARRALVPQARAEDRAAIEQRMHEIASEWRAHGRAWPEPDPLPAGADPLEVLVGAAEDGDLALADAAYVALCDTAAPTQVLDVLAAVTLDRLGGAAHASIFVDQFGRIPDLGPRHLRAGRALVLDVVRHWSWRLHWLDEWPGTATGELAERLLDVPSPGGLESNFIYPTMDLVDRTGTAARTVAAAFVTPVDEAERQLLTVAALSMLQDDPKAAPYGWSHCLTMPQATLHTAHRVADPQRAVAVAATYTCGFRATLSTSKVDPTWEPSAPRPGTSLREAGPEDAASLLWHADDGERAALLAELAGIGGSAPDAHLAKYVEACLTAARRDPGHARLYHASAASLAGWWNANGTDA
jgi:hypothetical protein